MGFLFVLILILRTILRCYVGNDSAANMDETALSPWVCVVRKSSHNRKVPSKILKIFLVRFPKWLL